MVIKILKLSKDATVPNYAHIGDAGIDLFSTETKVLKPNERYSFKLGIASEIPKGYVALIWDKSGLSSKFGLHVLAGVVDSTYRGEWQIVILNLSKKSYKFLKGDKLAQCLIQKVEQVKIKETKKLSQTKRGGSAFGSTGR